MDILYFDKPIDRTNTSCSYSTKWLALEERFPGMNTQNVLPMWIADMDFRCPPTVIDAMKARCDHGIFGYTDNSLVTEFIQAATNWFKRRYGWNISPNCGVFIPGVIPAINSTIQEFTNPGDGVIIQPPVYYPFSDGIANNGRKIINNRLLRANDGRYYFDFKNLEYLAREPSTKLIILSNPHNPVGRVWTKPELLQLCNICLKNNLLIFADEIHADIIMPGYCHTPVASLSEEIANCTISAYAPSKTFNLAGLGASTIFATNEKILSRIKKRLLSNRYPKSNVFGPLAGKIAYNSGDEYVDLLIEYINKNINYFLKYCNLNMPLITVYKPEGTYMIWLDFNLLGLSAEEVNRFMIEKAKIAGDLGSWFGPGGGGFVRLNLACPYSIVQQAAHQLKHAYNELLKTSTI